MVSTPHAPVYSGNVRLSPPFFAWEAAPATIRSEERRIVQVHGGVIGKASPRLDSLSLSCYNKSSS